MISFSIHPEGWRFAGIFFVVTYILSLLSSTLGVLSLIATLWCLYFFRNPPRVTPQRADAVVSPADGLIVGITSLIPPSTLGLPNEIHTRISIFLNIFDVHLNRIPLAGTVTKKTYHKGKFINASLDKASEDNERLSLTIDTYAGSYAVIQIAGLIARRIVCKVEEGEIVNTGQLYGLIRFGSRVDLYLPETIDVLVTKGQRMIGGETVIGTTKNVIADLSRT